MDALLMALFYGCVSNITPQLSWYNLRVVMFVQVMVSDLVRYLTSIYNTLAQSVLLSLTLLILVIMANLVEAD
jgi:hypothetical protein